MTEREKIYNGLLKEFELVGQEALFYKMDKLISLYSEENKKPYQSFVASIVASPDENEDMTELRFDVIYENTLETQTLNNGTLILLPELVIEKNNPGNFHIGRKIKHYSDKSGIGAWFDSVYSLASSYDYDKVAVFSKLNNFGDITSTTQPTSQISYLKEDGLIYLKSVNSSGEFADGILTDEEGFWPIFIEIRIYK